METSTAQPTSNIAFALETVNKGARQVTQKEPLPGLLSCISMTFTEASSYKKKNSMVNSLRGRNTGEQNVF